MKRVKAITGKGVLNFGDVEVESYVVDGDIRVITNSGFVAAFSGQHGSTNLGQYIDRLRRRGVELALSTEIEFDLPGGGCAVGRPATDLLKICNAYCEARDAGVLHSSQVPIAIRAGKISRACGSVGIIALVDEATSFQAKRAADALGAVFPLILHESRQPWVRFWEPQLITEIARLYKQPWHGGRQPGKWCARVQQRIYECVLSKIVYRELKSRCPNPHAGDNLHQYLRSHIRDHFEVILAFAAVSSTKGEFWRAMRRRFRGDMVQVDLLDAAAE